MTTRFAARLSGFSPRSIWRAVTVPATTVAANTYLEFDYYGEPTAEMQAIGIDTDANYNNGRYLFKLAGNETNNVFMTHQPQYQASEGWRHYRIRLADFQSQSSWKSRPMAKESLVKVRLSRVTNFLHPGVCRELAHGQVPVATADSRSQSLPNDDKCVGNTSGNALLTSSRKVERNQHLRKGVA